MESSIQNLQLNIGNKMIIGIDPAKGDSTAVMPMPSTDQDKSIAEQICAITTLAVLNASVLHIEVEYIPWLSSFTVKVFEVTTDYMKAHPNHFRRIKVGEAKDKLMGAV